MKTESANCNTSESNGIRYSYCLDENDELIHISEVTKEDRKVHKYKCLCCGREMIAKLGNGGKCPHFAHDKGYSCNSETYLHKLAKIRIKECFDKGNLTFTYYDWAPCGMCKDCRMYDNDKCFGEMEEKRNLCEFYDTCEEEKGVDGFVADLLLTKSDNPQIPPVLIEVYVKHKCSEDKVSKGLKIFETKQIRSEQDIEDIVNNGIITSSLELSKYYKNGVGYNVKPTKRYKADISRFILFPTWGSKIAPVSCDKRGEVFDNTSLVELNINYKNLLKKGYGEDFVSSPKMIGLLYVAHRAPKYKNCILCKYLGEFDYKSFCPLSRKYGTPQSPRESYGMRCNYFHIVELYRSIKVEDLYECIELVKEEPIKID